MSRVLYYRTEDGRADYGFSFERQGDDTWLVYIVSQPSYRGRATDTYSTHRLSDSDGRKYICWSSPIESYEDAKKIAKLWAEGTQKYIKTGEKF